MSYTIGQIAKKANLPPSTLRYYDKEGLLPFLSRSANGIRIFTDKDVELLRIIDCLKKAGMPIRAIKHFMDLATQGDATISERLELIRQQQTMVATQITQLQSTLEILNYKAWYYETALQAGSCKIHDNMSEEEIPEKFRAVYDKLKGK